uniref:Uncharacterized protein n=1 Tax=Timema genevievae TaxID=629358 RepID=A0A7R9K1L0_TIMGE|nr:unnamed protein product [Timema genevievae]
MCSHRPLYLSSALAQATPPTLSTAWTAPLSTFSKPSVTSSPFYSALEMGRTAHSWERLIVRDRPDTGKWLIVRDRPDTGKWLIIRDRPTAFNHYVSCAMARYGIPSPQSFGTSWFYSVVRLKTQPQAKQHYTDLHDSRNLSKLALFWYSLRFEIQVDFEGRNPIDSDFHGIKQLLQQLFLKAHINLAELTDLIIGQSYVGSVVKQSELDEDDSDDGTDANDVFGITTVVNLTDKQNLECVQQLRTLLIELCSEHATDQTNTLVRSLLGDDTRPVGLLINERFVNIPSQIAVPLLDSLR